MNKNRILITIGLLIIVSASILKHVYPGLPDSVYGLCFGIGIGVEILAVYVKNRDQAKKRVRSEVSQKGI